MQLGRRVERRAADAARRMPLAYAGDDS
jgi:hypothetical protein